MFTHIREIIRKCIMNGLLFDHGPSKISDVMAKKKVFVVLAARYLTILYWANRRHWTLLCK